MSGLSARTTTRSARHSAGARVQVSRVPSDITVCKWKRNAYTYGGRSVGWVAGDRLRDLSRVTYDTSARKYREIIGLRWLVRY
jgi:hypothetical protein